MPAPGWEDLSAFLQTDEFASTATVSLQDGSTRSVVGIFDDPFLNAQIGEYELETSRPRMSCAASDLEGIRRGDTATIDGETFDVVSGPQPDGTGMAILDLARRHE